MVWAARKQDVAGHRRKKWLNTPAGWYRANQLYDRAARPPLDTLWGSLVDVICEYVFECRSKEDVRHARLLSLAAMGAPAEDVERVYKQYLDARMPFLEAVGAEEREKAMKRLSRIAQEEVYMVRPIGPSKDALRSARYKESRRLFEERRRERDSGLAIERLEDDPSRRGRG